MIAEKPERYPRGTYKLLLTKHLDSPDAISGFHLVNLATGCRVQSNMVWDLVRFIEDDISNNRYPEYTIRYRTWSTKQDNGYKWTDTYDAYGINRTMDNTEMIISSFLLRIMHQQNATWQGTLQWIESMQTRQYRSVNELLSLINEAVSLSTGRLEKTPQEA
jgi:hypothetical protein